MAKVHSSLATTELHNPKGMGVESATEIILTMSASLGAVSASASMVPHTTDVFNLGSDSQRWNNITAKGNISSSATSTGSFGRLELAGNAEMDGTLTIAGGTTTLGDSDSDTVVITADLASNLIPDADGTRDIGSSAASWRNIHLDGTGSFKNTIIENREYFSDAGGEYISGDGTDLTITSGRDLNLTAATDINIPADVGLTFGDDAEKIEGDGTDLTVTGNNIKLTATADVVLAANTGLVLDGSGDEKIESDGTDISVSVGSGGDINIPANIGLTFGDDAEKIEGDGTDLTITGNNINLTPTADVNIPVNKGITFATAEKIESDGTDLSITVGGGGDINIPANIGLTFGDDGEKIEGDGTDLTITGNNINLTGTADVKVPANVGIMLGTHEKIESDDTDLTITVGSGGDINIPANIGLTFGDDGEKIEGDGTDLTVASSAALTLDVGTDLAINVDGGDITVFDDTAHIANISATAISGSSASTGSFAYGIINDALGIGTKQPGAELEVLGNVSGSGTGSFMHGLVRDRIYFFDSGGEYIYGDGTDLNFVSSADINVPANIGMTFGDDGEKIEGNGTDLTIASSNDLHLTATTDINIPANVGLTFGDDAEKIEGDGTDLTITGNNIVLSPTADVKVPVNKGVMFGTHEKIESDDTDLTITVGSGGDINVGANIGMTFGDDGEKIEGDGTDLTIASSAKLNLTATSDVHVPKNVGIVFDDDASEKIESNDTDLTINSGADINLTATTDINVPANVGMTFGDDGEKIEGDGTDMTIASSGVLTLSSGGNTVIETVTLNDGNVTIPGDLTVTGNRLEAQVGSLQVADHTITVGSGSATSALMHNGGIDWGVSGSVAFLRYRHAGTAISSSVFLEAPKLTVDTITLDAAEIDATGALTIDTGGDLTLDATGDVNVPANIGMTFGNDGEKIEGDGTDLTIASSNLLNLTATTDVKIPVNVGLMFGTHEKIESDDTDLSFSVGSGGDINIPADIGLTFGNDGEKIEGDGTDLTITGNNINLTGTADVKVPANVGIMFGTHEKIESDDTDLSITVGSGGDVNIPANIGLTFGDDGEKIEGDGTDLTISGNKIKLDSTVISGSSTSTGSFGRTSTSTLDLDSIQGNWTNAGNTIADLGTVTTADINGGTVDGITSLTAGGNLDIGAHDFRAQSLIADGRTAGRMAFYGTNGELSDDSTLTFADNALKVRFIDAENEVSQIYNFKTISGSADGTGSFANVFVANRLSFNDHSGNATGEYIESDGTDLSINVGGSGDINIPANIGMTFGDDGEKIEGDGTDLTIASSRLLNLSATTDVVIPTNVGLHFTDSAEKIESDGTDFTFNSGNDINLTATTDVNIPANVGLTFGNDGEKIEGDGTDLTIAGAKINLTAESDVYIPQNIGLVFDANGSEKIESDDTDLTINSGAKINLTATSDVHIPNNVGIVFGGASEKIEGDGTDLVISANNLTVDAAADIILDAGGNDTVIKSGGTTIASFKNASSDFVIVTDVDDKDIIFKGQDSTSEITALTLDMSAAGLANFNNDVVAFYSSDERLKDNVVKIGDPLMKLSELRGVEFDWNDNKEVFAGEHSYGVIAQEVEKVLPEIVTERGDGYKAVKYELIVPLLIESIKELHKKVEHIEKNCECLDK